MARKAKNKARSAPSPVGEGWRRQARRGGDRKAAKKSIRSLRRHSPASGGARKSGASRSHRHDGDREPARRHRARDDQHAAARRALRRHLERARLLLLHPHRRQSPAGVGRGPAGAHLRRPFPGREHVQVPRGRHPRGRRLSRQRPLWRQHASRRPHLPGPGVHRGRAPVHDGRQVPHGRHRQQHSVELFRQGARRLRGRRAGVSGRAHPAQFQERARHHPHVPRAHPRAGAVVRRLARRARLGAHRRAPAQAAVREIRKARPSRPSSATGSTIPSGA